MKTRLIKWAAVMACACIACGILCAGAARPDPKARIEQYWKLMVDARYESCYNMLSAASQEKYEFKKYSRLRNIAVSKLIGITIVPDASNPNVTKAQIQYDGVVLGREFKGLMIKQTWVYENDNWFLVYVIPNPFEKAKGESPSTTPVVQDGKPRYPINNRPTPADLNRGPAAVTGTSQPVDTTAAPPSTGQKK